MSWITSLLLKILDWQFHLTALSPGTEVTLTIINKRPRFFICQQISQGITNVFVMTNFTENIVSTDMILNAHPKSKLSWIIISHVYSIPDPSFLLAIHSHSDKQLKWTIITLTSTVYFILSAINSTLKCILYGFLGIQITRYRTPEYFNKSCLISPANLLVQVRV